MNWFYKKNKLAIILKSPYSTCYAMVMTQSVNCPYQTNYGMFEMHSVFVQPVGSVARREIQNRFRLLYMRDFSLFESGMKTSIFLKTKRYELTAR